MERTIQTIEDSYTNAFEQYVALSNTFNALAAGNMADPRIPCVADFLLGSLGIAPALDGPSKIAALEYAKGDMALVEAYTGIGLSKALLTRLDLLGNFGDLVLFAKGPPPNGRGCQPARGPRRHQNMRKQPVCGTGHDR